MKKKLSIILCITLMLTMFTGYVNASSNVEETDFSKSDKDMFSDRDYESGYSESESILIQLNGNSAVASADSVKISGTTVTITEEASYVISGTLDDGVIIVEADDTAKLQLILNGVNINSDDAAALYILSADKVFVTLADGTENIITNGGVFEPIDENNMDGTVYSRQDLTFNGSGALTVSSPAGHGIVCKDDLVFTGGTYTVNAASHGMDANDSVRIANASISIKAGKDGIHSENTEDTSLGFVYISSGTMDIEAEGDGISAGAYLQVQDGTIQLLTGGGYENGTSKSSASYGGFKGGGKQGRSSENNNNSVTVSAQSGISMAGSEESSTSMKGVKAASGILISNGMLTIDSADDSIHSDTSVMINGGTFEIASGDGLDSNGTLTISGGTVYVANPTSGDTSIIDADVSPVITGGTFISTGSTTMMAQTFASSSSQGVITCTTGTQSPGSTVTVKDSDGNSVISYEVEYTCAMVIISSPDIVKGDTYTLVIGTTSGSVQAD